MPDPTHPAHPIQPTDPTAERLTRLEESQGFADHRLDQLAEQLVALNRSIDEFARRLALVEGRMAHDQSVRDHLAAQPPSADDGDDQR